MSPSGRKLSIAWLPAAPQEGWTSMDRYWRELQHVARSEAATDWVITCPFGDAPVVSHREKSWRRPWMKYFIYPRMVSRLRVDLVHLLDHSYAHLLRYLRPGTCSVATAFDLVPLLDSQGLSRRQVRRFEKSVRNLAKADLVLAMSHQTEHDLVRLAGVAPERIRVIYPGTNLSGFATPVEDFPARSLLPSTGMIILSVGHTGPRKNLPFLLEAFAPLKERFRSKRCVFVRAGALLDPENSARFRELLGEGFIELGPRYGSELAGIYQRARIFVMPSTLEGFSFTMMEAMAAGVPVVANRISTNPEVGADAVLYHENGDAAGAARQLEALLDDCELWRDYKHRGLMRVGQLTWEKHWNEIKCAYQTALGSKV